MARLGRIVRAAAGVAVVAVTTPTAEGACLKLQKNILPTGIPSFVSCHTYLAPTSDFVFVDVLGLPLLATNVREKEVMHAANILAKYLDNDEDGKVDDPKILEAFAKKTTLLWVHGQKQEDRAAIHQKCRTEHGSSQWVHNVFALSAVNDATNVPPSYSFGNVNPNSLHLKIPHTPAAGCNDVWDATLEETFHLLSDGGAAEAYPAQWEDANLADVNQWATSTLAGFVKALFNAGDYDPFGDGPSNDPGPKTIVGEGCHFGMLTTLAAYNLTDAGSPLTNGQWKVPNPATFEAKYPAYAAFLADNTKYPWVPSVLPDGNYKYGFPQQGTCALAKDVAAQCPKDFQTFVGVASGAQRMALPMLGLVVAALLGLA